MSTQGKRISDSVRSKISLQPSVSSVTMEDIKERLLEMQLKMATSSINHEYARLEYDDTDDRERREELLEFMEDCRSQYFEARTALAIHDPYALADFEADLLRQKQSTISCYNI